MKKALVCSDKTVTRSELKTKFTLFFLLIGIFIGKANYDHSPNTKISLDLNGATLLEMFNEIEDKTKFTFFYKNDEINPGQKVTIKVVQKSVPVILARLFENNVLVHEINGKQIIVKKNQKAQINGIVIDKATSEPIPYCNIAVASSYVGTACNELGEFVLDVEALPAKLVFSHLNYEKQQLEVSETLDLIIELVPLKQADVENNSFISELDSSVTRYNYNNPVEKVYLHTDKDLFSAGENLWYSGYTVLGEHHQFSMASKVLHVDLIGPNNKIILSQTNEIVNGKAIGSIELPKDLISGNYQLRSYTNWMRNFDPDFFFTKMVKVVGATEMPVPPQNMMDTIDLQFFPEGGHAVAGLLGQIAFKAIGSDGLDRKIRGYVKDSQGKPVVHLGTITRGSGFFYLLPKLGEHYTAILDNGSEYPLPKIMGQGYTMTINNTGPENIKIKIQATDRLRKEPFYIVGHLNNKKYYQGEFKFKNQETLSFEMPKNELPSGVMALTLFDQNKKPWCERVVFINNQKGLVITAKISPEKISKRSEIAVDINVTDPYGEPVTTELSLAVTDKGQVVKNPDSGNIMTHLLLQSDIKGHIQNPGLLFKDQNRLTLHAMDLVMLTHGWRKFPWQEIQEGSFPNKEFDFAKGLTISGTTRGLYDKTLKRMNLRAIAKSGEKYGMFTVKTSNNGRFFIPDFNFRDTTKVIFSAYDQKNRPLHLKVVLNSNDLIPPIPQFKNPPPNSKEIEVYVADYSVRREMSSFYKSEKTVKLEEVVVTKKVAKRVKTPHATLYTKDIGETAPSIMDFVSRFAGVKIYGAYPNIRINIHGRTAPPLWVLNGVPVRNNFETVPSQIADLDISNVEKVEYVPARNAFFYGKIGGVNGVFLVYTKRGGKSGLKLSPEFDIAGHTAEREFYSPNYSIKLDRHSLPDYRATLYWNPSFRTNNNGNARLLFYNSDNAEQLQVAIEGLSDKGTPGAYLKTFGDKEGKL